jgi:hypothetical protein
MRKHIHKENWYARKLIAEKIARSCFMKRKIGMVVVLVFALAAFIYAQTANEAYSAIRGEAQRYVNGCGPDGWGPQVTSLLNRLSGNASACNQHDLDYMTLGISKDRADMDLGEALFVDQFGEYHHAIALGFYAAVRTSRADTAYRNAQSRARQAFRNIHHGHEWNSNYGKWNPSYGHVRVSFPECIPSCSY